MAVLDHQRAGHQLMVQRLIAGLQHLVRRDPAGDDARRGEGMADDAVHLVEGQPVFDEVLIPHKADMAELGEAVDDPAIHPAVVLGGQGQRHLVVAQGDQRLDAQTAHLGEKVLIELQAFLVGFGLLAGGEDPGPGDGDPQHGKAHLGKEGEVLLVVMVEVDTPAFGVGRVAGVRHGGGDLVVAHGVVGRVVLHVGVGLIGGHIGHAGTLAVHIPSAFGLVGGQSAAPEKSLGETHNKYLRFGRYSKRADAAPGARPAVYAVTGWRFPSRG